MSKGGSSAPAPDPNIGRAALMQAETGEKWLTFAKDAFAISTERQAELDALTRQVTEQQLGIAGDQADWARSDRERYESTFKPIEDEFIAEARDYGSPERQEQAAAEAKADVATAAAASKEQATRTATAMGINPASGRYAGIDRAADLGTALASASAQNQARVMTRDKGLALKADIANLGRGLPAQSAQATALGLNAGSSAVGLNQGTNAQFIASTDIMGSGYKGAMAGYAGMGQTLNTQYANQINAWQAEQQAKAANAAGIGSAIGGLAGLIFSDENIKTDKTELPEGTALEAVMEMPVEEWTYKQGYVDEGRHVGPYAQDFQRATGKGDGKTIPAVDAVGVTLAAVQDLNRKVDKMADAIGLGQEIKADKPKKPAAKKKQSRAIGLGDEE